MKKSIHFFIALVLALILIAVPNLAAKEIKVGIVDCYSGPASTYTNDVRDAFKLEVDKINAAGGILGHKIVFFTRDNTSFIFLAALMQCVFSPVIRSLFFNCTIIEVILMRLAHQKYILM